MSVAKMKIREKNPSQDSSGGSILAWYRGGPGFKSRQGREFFNENKQLIKFEFEYCIESRLHVGTLVQMPTEVRHVKDCNL